MNGAVRPIVSVCLALVAASPACHGHRRAAPRPEPDAATACRGRQALVALSEFHERVLSHLGLAGEGLFTGDADPQRFRDLAALLHKTARRLGGWTSGDRLVDSLVAMRARVMEAMARKWEAMATALEASDKERFQKEREGLIELRAKDLALRKDLRKLYQACGLPPPI